MSCVTLHLTNSYRTSESPLASVLSTYRSSQRILCNIQILQNMNDYSMQIRQIDCTRRTHTLTYTLLKNAAVAR